MNETPKVGSLIGKDEVARRDAIHIAVAPVIAGTPIRPGSHIRLTETGLGVWASYKDGETIGIADPFLKEEIRRGERFWLFLYPNTITSLRHVWTHPAFVTTLKKEEANESPPIS